MIDLQKIKLKYVNCAMQHAKASAAGDYKTANKAYEELKNIFRTIENQTVNYELLVELLDDKRMIVRGWAATQLLGLKQDTDKAIKVLNIIAETTGKDAEEKLRILSAQMVLKNWNDKGYVKF